LQGQNPNFAFANSWLEHRLADQGLTIEQLVRAEGQAQAADQVSIGNSINSLRFLNSNDWRQFVGEHSLVEQTLAGDPSGIYAEMDFATATGTDTRSKVSPTAPTDRVRRSAQDGATGETQAREQPRPRGTWVFLVDRGRPVLEPWPNAALRQSCDKLRRKLPLRVIFRPGARDARGDLFSVVALR
jgi:hypothetical protein